ncbi:DUF29 domain-containing protein [Symplocastrum sp. BBK-W-15]|uniref:DUF29 domain-containing protein n=1 Tax=Limnofasciculus baicalensis BBK-W-15 TaxID=2699891 RepID=A0AAE3GRQ3_9CYAN|nr:DUF29 domain-containing protein [Limnofasciculus baicalensis BBK-W-15]
MQASETNPKIAILTPNLYETDFYAWTKEQVSLLRNHQWDKIDLFNVIEEIEALGRKERQELRNRLAILLGHLLKWQFQPQKRTNSWFGTIREQRIQIKLLLEDSPSLKSCLDEVFLAAYEIGLALAIKETQLGEQVFPEASPYTLEQTLNPKFLTNILQDPFAPGEGSDLAE